VRAILTGLAVAILSLPAGCGGGGPTSPSTSVDTSATLSFTVAPIDPASIQFIVPLGNMGPWAHTFPTDHAYIYHHLGAGTFAPVTVFTPASGTISNTYPGINGEVKAWVKVNSRYTYYFDHVVLAPGLGLGSAVTAGSVFGTSTGIAFDFAVTDQTTTQSFITPARYGMDTIYARSPWPYFTEPLRTSLYAKVQRSGSDLDGKINFDVAGTLSGNWFADDLPVSQSSGNDINIGGKQLSFARDVRFPDRQRVSIGGFNFTGLYGVPPESPDFAAINTNSGVVTYRLLNTGEPGGPAGTTQVGLLLVQLTDTSHLNVEIVPDQVLMTASFSGNAKAYVR
jgi:hypothetical protein